MNIEPLLEALVNVIVFFENASDEVLDPDDAVRQMESLSVSLQAADEPTRQALIAYIHRRSISETDIPTRLVLVRLPEDLGLM